MKKNYDEVSVVRDLTKKGVKFSTTKVADKAIKNIYIADASLGNGSFGKVDYLCNHCGYTLITEKPKVESKSTTVDSESIRFRKTKRINMADMARTAMSKAKLK